MLTTKFIVFVHKYGIKSYSTWDEHARLHITSIYLLQMYEGLWNVVYIMIWITKSLVISKIRCVVFKHGDTCWFDKGFKP